MTHNPILWPFVIVFAAMSNSWLQLRRTEKLVPKAFRYRLPLHVGFARRKAVRVDPSGQASHIWLVVQIDHDGCCLTCGAHIPSGIQCDACKGRAA